MDEESQIVTVLNLLDELMLERAQKTLATLKNVNNSLNTTNVTLASWKALGGGAVDHESQTERVKRLVLWARNEDPQLGQMVELLFKRYPASIEVSELVVALDVKLLALAHQRFNERIERLRSLGLVVLEGSVSSPSVRVSESVFN